MVVKIFVVECCDVHVYISWCILVLWRNTPLWSG